MTTASAAPPSGPRDMVQRIHRVTRENRHLWYQLTVLQQPERARACGSGMKANSDRRPVDPPPVVELRIIEGPSVEEGKDITFDYNANFFLYASLEQARTIAHGRVQNGATNNPPILTGVPASGMAYLDRPTEAGYFIFPDLSVRHEGYFRLSFSLYETTKEAKDFDLEPTESDLPPGVDWRMEIKTQPFNVFSAKKFPGLMESTSLSKTVADQGCRVRIRRDVRMRKRDGKGSGGYDRREDEYNRRRTVTPAPAEDPHGLRARSTSNASEHRVPYMPQEPQRRPSAAESYHAPSLPPPPPPSYDAPPPSRPGHLAFGEPSLPQYGAPVPPRPYAHPQSAPIPPVTPTGPYSAATTPSPYAKADPQPYNYGRPPSVPSASPVPPMRHAIYDSRPSEPYVPPSPSVYSSTERRPSHVSYPPAPMAPYSAPPPPPPRREMPSQASLAPLKIAALVSPLPPIEAQTEPLPPPPLMPTGGKRKHDYVFSQSHKPLHNGQRQLDAHFGHGYRGLTPEPDQGLYSRADGQIGVVTFNQYQV
ncbi:red and blue light sensing [Trichoderma arundinaceum]|uniref:Developmental and secondary metabolism regulator VEL1 n=1 Tax=Trichoderma arundinaceum TaxID=490622 RepID=A0A395NJQ5_TRIAR|nr:red and blue light sensing [Trichoderma arundinaceum]